ncbi:MAG: HD domain-containing protein [Lachnospiraceae bacterium]|nr:HD domain-containing protein [Lachnospiraceae bacterium]
MDKFNKLSVENEELFKKVYREIRQNPRFKECDKYISHGNTSVKTHVITVTLLALNLSEKLKIKVDKIKLIRGALLHDFYLYDWHDKKLIELHGFHHPKKAVREALKDYNLSEIEIDIIKHHMFPLTYNAPKSREARLLCIADKICAWGETVDGKLAYLVS